MNYKEIVEARYNRQKWQELLYDIFRNKVQFWQQPQPVVVDESMAKRALYTGKINLPDGHTIAIYEVELSDSVAIERNRAGIRNLLCTNWRGMGCAGAFMFCFRQYEAVLRFSYVSEAFTFAEDGSLKKDSTDTKRFTYLLGEGHRSRTAIQQFEKLKASGLTLKDITKAFSVEALSDLFFKEYKKQYEDIIEFVTGKRMVKVANKWEEQVTGQPCREIMQEFGLFPDAEKAVRDYVKKLMGRLVFIQFLQKKGWMGCSAGESWNDGDREFVQNLFANTTHNNTFVDDVLEPLFLDINTKRNGDIASSQNVGDGIKIPYLNGGLFEKDDFDKTKFPLPAKYMKNLLDFFASYNFTIDENDPDDAEIGVDPEMLGRIFENLLEDNKDKGAFYTPKEIVQYMCRESLIAYLQTDVEDEAVKLQIREFVTTNNADLLSADLAESIDQKLKDVKICDPAIGSGAFPMGLLRELYACRKAIEGIDDGNAVRIKTHIIQNNIYGVDIEKGAVDIARLRFWLALIVDEDTPHALPNMDFKIMQGNSLLEQYEGVELSGMSLNEQKKRKTKKGDAYQVSLAFDEKTALENIQKAIKQYYLTDNHETKLNLRKTIDDNVKSYILNLKGCTPDIQRKLEKLPIPNDQFFLWHIYFKEVFDKGGFDIVIGNPPYGVSIKGDYRESVVKAVGKVPDFEIYYYFIELSKKILRNQGILSYIIPNTWLFNTFAKNYRIGMLETWNFIEVLDCSKFKIFDSATVMNSLLLIQKSEVKYNEVVYRPTDKATDFISLVREKRSAMSREQLLKMNQNWGLAFRLSSDRLNLVQKISSNSLTLSNYFDCSQGYIPYRLSDLIMTYGEVEGTRIKKERLWHSEQQSDEFWIRELYGRDITKYNYFSTGEFVKYGPHVATYVDPRFFNQKRVVVREITNPCIIACIVEDTYLNDPQLLPLIKKDSNVVFEYESLWAILNSKIATFYHFNHSPKATKGAFPKILILDLNTFPIPELKSEIMSDLQTKAKVLLMTKKSNPQADTTAEEREIDRLVYDLYGLTEDEIAIVEGAI